MANNWAIVVGINEYEFLPNASLKFAVADALAMRKFLCEEAGFDAEKVLLCGDGRNGTRKATKPNLRDILLNKLQPAYNADNLWFFFSGHGLAGGDQQDYLMTIDGNPSDLQATAIPTHFVADRLRACKAKNIVLVLDMCRNENRDAERKSVELQRERQQGIITMHSCDRGQSSYEISDLKQGAFTYALLQGLREKVLVRDLALYLESRVTELHRSVGKSQRVQVPRVIPDPGWKYDKPILTTLVPEIAELEKQATDAESDGNFQKALGLWEKVNLLVSKSFTRRRMLYLGLGSVGTVGTIALRFNNFRSTTSSPSPSQSPQQTSKITLETFSFPTVKLNPKGEIIKREILQAQQFISAFDIKMVKVKGGTFKMGSSETETDRSEDEGPQHNLRVPDFFIGKCVITQVQWKLVSALSKVNIDLKIDPSKFKGNRLPVERVSWLEAMEFCDRLSTYTALSYRLPTEAEWEYACRSGTQTPFYFGETITADVANYQGRDWTFGGKTYPGNYGDGPKGKYLGKTTDVGTYPANAWGLYDMHGNVWEWCMDCYEDYKDSPINVTVCTTDERNVNRVFRGGSWTYLPWGCRSASRGNSSPDLHSNYVGFRVVCSLSAPKSL